MITCMVAIDSMPVTNPKEPIILNRAKVLNNEVSILICFRRLVWYVSSPSFKSILGYRVLEAAVLYC